MTLATLRTHTEAVLAALNTDILTGDGVAPSGGGWVDAPGRSEFTPYVVLHPTSGTFDGTLGAPDDDADLAWQLTCVGETRKQAEWAADIALAAIIGQPLTVAGRSVLRVRLTDTGVTRRDDTDQPPVWIATPRVAAYTTPS